MKAKPLPAAAYLRECFDYDPETGMLTWKRRPRRHFRNSVSELLRWNKRWAGTVAGTQMTDGYVAVHVDGEMYKAPRIIWKMQTGETPKSLDHKNGDHADNRWDNLREATTQQNRWNSRYTHGRKLLRGVYLSPSGRYMAILYTTRDGRRTNKSLGTFDKEWQAHAAWIAGARAQRGKFFRI